MDTGWATRHFQLAAGGVLNLYWQTADGTGTAERLTESGNAQNATSVSADGTRVVFNELTQTRRRDLMLLALGETRRRVQALLQTPFDERNGTISPDQRWLAYESDSSGRFEIYVRPFPSVKRRANGRFPRRRGTQPLSDTHR